MAIARVYIEKVQGSGDFVHLEQVRWYGISESIAKAYLSRFMGR